MSLSDERMTMVLIGSGKVCRHIGNLGRNFGVQLNRGIKYLIQDVSFENVVCQMSMNLFRPRCLNLQQTF